MNVHYEEMPPSPKEEGLGMRFCQKKFRINVNIREISTNLSLSGQMKRKRQDRSQVCKTLRQYLGLGTLRV